jgi:hypothetical protein
MTAGGWTVADCRFFGVLHEDALKIHTMLIVGRINQFQIFHDVTFILPFVLKVSHAVFAAWKA